MNNIVVRVIKQPQKYWAKFLLNFSWLLSDKAYLKIMFMYAFGYPLDLDNPKTFCEKLQWLKLYDRQPEYTKMVDKYEVKQYVANKIGSEHIIPTLGVWDKPEDIDWDKLPNQFVLKTTHGGGGNGVIICKDKNVLNKKDVEKRLQNSLDIDLYKEFREWPYKNVHRRIIAEQYMEDKGHPDDLADYKFFCFNGEPKFCQVIRNRHAKETIDFYDMNWIHQEFVGLNPVAHNGLNPVAHNGLNPVARPVHLEEMVEACRKLAETIPFARIDLYVINDKEYFGEITFFPASGMGVFSPNSYNELLGKMITLPGEAMGGGNNKA